MKVFFDLFGARGCAPLILIKDLSVDARVREPEVN